jgi:transcriptional regulator with XRE-family HTH domain
VAELAGVGVTWYTWLEQARAVNPSVEVLDALADTLGLDGAKRRHLFVLADRAPALIRDAGPEVVADPIRRMLDSLESQPALVTGRRWDILAWNRAAEAVFGDYRRLEGDACNMMYLMFAEPRHRAMLVDWRSIAATALATFRADYAPYRGDPDFERLIAKLKAVSAEFREWWVGQDVLPPLPGCKRIDHPVAGRLAFEYTTFAVADSVGLRLAVFTPLPEEDTERKLRELTRSADRRAWNDARAIPADAT